MIGYILSSLTAGLQAASDTISSVVRVEDRYIKTLLITLVALIFSLILALVTGFSITKFTFSVVMLVVVTTVFSTLGQVSFYEGISKAPLHVTLPFLSLTPIGVLVVQWVVSAFVATLGIKLPEVLEPLRIFMLPSLGSLFGMFVIIISTGYISFMVAKDFSNSASSTNRSDTRKSILSVIEAALIWWSISTIGDSIASRAIGPIPYLFSFLLVRSIILTFITFRNRHSYRLYLEKSLKTIVATGTLMSLASMFQNISLLFINVAVFSAIKRLQIVFGIFLGMKFLKEKPRTSIIVASCIAWAGVVVTYLFK